MSGNQATSPRPPYTPKEVAGMERCNTETIYRAIWMGEIAAYKVGGCWRISEEALATYRQLHLVSATGLTERRVALVQAALDQLNGRRSLDELVEATGLKRTIAQDCLTRLGYSWTTGDGALRRVVNG